MVAVLRALQCFHESSLYHCTLQGTHTGIKSLPLPQPDSSYLPLRHSCHAVSFVISNRKMPNEGDYGVNLGATTLSPTTLLYRRPDVIAILFYLRVAERLKPCLPRLSRLPIPCPDKNGIFVLALIFIYIVPVLTGVCSLKVA
jgi:hypothetical protein